MSSGKVLLGILAGAAVGAISGILFAPAKGSRTRKRILKKGEHYTDMVKEKVDDLFEEITDKVETMKEDISDFAEKTMGKAEDAEKKIKNAKG